MYRSAAGVTPARSYLDRIHRDPPEVMPNPVRYIENGEIEPALAATYPLEDLYAAQVPLSAKPIPATLWSPHENHQNLSLSRRSPARASLLVVRRAAKIRSP